MSHHIGRPFNDEYEPQPIVTNIHCPILKKERAKRFLALRVFGKRCEVLGCKHLDECQQEALLYNSHQPNHK